MNIWRSVTTLPLARCFGDFGLGLVAFRFRNSIGLLKSDLALAALLAIFALGLIVHATDLLLLAIIFPTVVGIAGNSGRVAGFLSTGSLHWLGTISYSIYLIHYPIVSLSRVLRNGAMNFAAVAISIVGTIVVVIALSAITYRVIEVPCRDWVKKRSAAILPTDSDEPVTASAGPL